MNTETAEFHSKKISRAALRKIELYFDPAFYLDQYPDVADAQLDPWKHFLANGRFERRAPNRLFDPLWYCSRYPDVVQSGIDPLLHYVEHGWREGRDPCGHFSTARYVHDHPDSIANGLTPMLHWLERNRWTGPAGAESACKSRGDADPARPVGVETPGLVQDQQATGVAGETGRAISDDLRNALCALFDPLHYRTTYLGGQGSDDDAMAAFFARGIALGHAPNRWFDGHWYAARYTSFVQTPQAALLHFADVGWRLGCDPGPHFCTRYYAARNGVPLEGSINPLANFIAAGSPQQRPHKPRRRILLISTYCPTRAHAGGLRTLDIYRHVRERQPETMLELVTHRNISIDWSHREIDELFDHVHDMPSYRFDFSAFERVNPDISYYDIVDFQFLPPLALMRAFRPHAGKMLFTPMELLSRHFDLKNLVSTADSAELAEQQATIEQETGAAQLADLVVCVSEPDASYLRKQTGINQVVSLETGISALEFEVEGVALERKPAKPPAVLYVAYFGSQTNVDALHWYLDKVHPLVKKAVPRHVFQVVGRGDLSGFADKVDRNVDLIGEVPMIGPMIAQATIGIAPALYGAGFRGKINQYAYLALPTVAHSLAASGLSYEDGRDIAIADSDADFAAAIVRLLKDHEAREAMGVAARERCLAEYSWAARASQLDAIYDIPPPHKGQRALTVDAIVPSYRHARYLPRRIESIVGQTYPHVQLTVVDDCSPDESDAVIRALQSVHNFNYVRRERNSGTPFSAWQHLRDHCQGDLVWICESDDYAEPEFLAEAITEFEKDPELCLFYCNSHQVDPDDKVIGSTATYFSEHWRNARWLRSFTADGLSELSHFQFRGMTVPNMSSAVMRRDAFMAAFDDRLLRYKLTGDWLFIGNLMRQGHVHFSPRHLSNFRQHSQTARAETQMARVQAEFILTKAQLHGIAGKPVNELRHTLETDRQRYRHERIAAWRIIREMLRIDLRYTIWLLAALPRILWQKKKV